ncbi:putative protein kinase RLK-Pelle-LRR-XII-1 family [Rosa chinensis]|uniref:Protein kinase domain-containing protein n=1 Tax=Rosa chinensis TaxID=74649 RepID=A0A2P6P8H1_ROSCH|nr:putative protein kinase RLK-Pelle-LRR-XII-1 family [Rosa chinensis]
MSISLQLLGNNLNGSIPSSLGKCHRLLELNLAQNNLDGTIPQQLLIGLPLSIYLYFQENRFSGSLPVEVGKLKSLRVIDILDNMLSGEFPNSLGGCENLEALHLQGNFFKGPIPSSMSALRGIQELDLSCNNLSGEIPQFLESFVFLKNLNLSFNQFWGEVHIKKLPTCKSKGGGLSHRMKVMISLVSVFAAIGIAMVLSVLFLFSSRTKRKETTLSNFGDSILQVSFTDLFKATDEFCSTNLIGMHGWFESVYKGVLDDGRVVAVKVFNMIQRGASKSFIAEREALRNIRHRNLVKIISACSSIY